MLIAATTVPALLAEGTTLSTALAATGGVSRGLALFAGKADVGGMRRAIHDELFRYFLTVDDHIGIRTRSELAYYQRPRVAIDACTSERAQRATVRPSSKVPELSRPAAFYRVADDLASLRKLVAFDAITAAISASYDPPMVGAVTGTTPRSAPTLAQTIAQGLASVPAVTARVSSQVDGLPGHPAFSLHAAVAEKCQLILTDTLPFGRAECVLPAAFTEVLAFIDSTEAWLCAALTAPPGQVAQQAWEALLPWGLALTAVMRVCVTELVVQLVWISLPIGRLFNEVDARGHQQLSLGDKTSEEKQVYNALLAIALYEALTGAPMPHVDAHPGDGYMLASATAARLAAPAAIARSFHTTWLDPVAPQFLSDLDSAFQRASAAPFLYDVETGSRSHPTITSQQLTLDGIGNLFAGYPTVPKKASDAQAWTQCGWFSSIVALRAAAQIAELLAAKLPGAGPLVRRRFDRKSRQFVSNKKPDPKFRLGIGSGSLRWGGNHPPHLEHRDGLTYDIAHYVDHVPWLLHDVPPEDEATAPKKHRKGQSIRAWGVVQTARQAQGENVVAAVKQRATQTCVNATLAKLVATLAKVPPSDLAQYDTRSEWADLVGLPILRSSDGDPDDGALQLNLIGHVALVLAGAARWIYAGPVQHLIALRTILSIDISKDIRSAITSAPLFFYPDNHNDHWHVVFRSWKDGGQAFQIWLKLWHDLGVDLAKLATELERDVRHANRFPAVEAERKTLASELAGAISKLGGPPDSSKLLDGLVKGIAAASYADTIDTDGLCRCIENNRATGYDVRPWVLPPTDYKDLPSA